MLHRAPPEVLISNGIATWTEAPSLNLLMPE